MRVGSSGWQHPARAFRADANCSLHAVDLTERGDSTTRHPWEVQRFDAYRRILADHEALAAHRVLDVGAGDGWFTDSLAEHLPADAMTTCWDVNYDDNDLEPVRPGAVRTRERPETTHDLILALDVLEHIADPGRFVAEALAPVTEPGASVLVSVPAFQRLYGAHDVALGHHRRYGRHQLLDQIAPWIDVIEHGSLFTSLLVPRAAAVAVGRLRRSQTHDRDHGVGSWTAGPGLTNITRSALGADVRVGRAAARVGLRLPGLSLWAFGIGR